MRALVVAQGIIVAGLAGCLGGPSDGLGPAVTLDSPPFLGYVPAAPDLNLTVVETAYLLRGAGVDVHARVVRPEGDGPFPVIVQFTPYTAPGRNPGLQGGVEPPVPLPGAVPLPGFGPPGGVFVNEFVRRGYAFVYADVRGTGDSSGCLDLRGAKDIADLYELTEHFGTRPWSTGKVGFIGASYPGSEAHMAALANNPHLAAVVPVVASTSFYHYHHNDGVPYNGQHSLGGTNFGYTQNAIGHTYNPQYPNYATRYVEEAGCPHKENILDHGGMDQSGAYDTWWAERNLRTQAAKVQVPVLMAQGLADWNVKPDHIAHWFNDLTAPTTLIAGQWPHQYPRSPCKANLAPPLCDDKVPYGPWWTYAAAFFDTHLKGVDTGMFRENVAWVQDSDGAWHRSSHWPLLPDEEGTLTFHLRADKTLAAAPDPGAAELAWFGCPNDHVNRGVAAGTPAGGVSLGTVEDATIDCDERPGQELVFESAPLESDTLLSGVPLVRLRLASDAASTHLVAVLARVAADGSDANGRENYGYLNPAFRDGLDAPRSLSSDGYDVILDLYPQEDLVKKGERLRLTLRSDDEGRTIESYDAGENRLRLGPDHENSITLPIRPLALQGVRLA